MVKRAVAAGVIVLAGRYVASYIVVNVFHTIPSESNFAQKSAIYSKLLTKPYVSYKIKE